MHDKYFLSLLFVAQSACCLRLSLFAAALLLPNQSLRRQTTDNLRRHICTSRPATLPLLLPEIEFTPKLKQPSKSLNNTKFMTEVANYLPNS